MRIRTKTLMSITIAVVLITMPTTFVGAQAPAGTRLPPLPEWPLIGPVLRFLGVVQEAAPETLHTPDPSLPEFRISTLEDVDQLRSVEMNERVRIIIDDQDLNQIISEVLSSAGYSEDAGLKVTFDGPAITADAYASATLIERTGVDIPASIRGNFDVLATFTVEAADCSVVLTFEKVKANSWSFGLRSAANRLVNDQIPEYWPEEICVENVIVMDGEAAVEGYHRE
jgi:hypothetical protein